MPGLNACIKSVTLGAVAQGWEVIGFRRGFSGVLNYDINDSDASQFHLMRLDPDNVRIINRVGGTILHTSRTSPDRFPATDLPAFLKDEALLAVDGKVDCTPHLLKVFEVLQIDALVAIGGDGTLNYAARLQREGMPTMMVPKTMDNDVFGTDYCIGFSTAVSRSVEFVSALRTTAGSHERIAVVELFGRNSGETALITGHLADVDRVLIAEVPIDMAKVAALLEKDRGDNPANYAIVIVSEGARLAQNATQEHVLAETPRVHKPGSIGSVVGDEITRRTGIDTITQNLGYLMRSGVPDALDLMVASSYGTMVIQLLADGEQGLMMAVRDGKYAHVPSNTCTHGKRRVDVDSFYDSVSYRPRISRVLAKPMFLY